MKIGFISTLRYASWGGSEHVWADAADVALEQGDKVLVSTYTLPEVAPRMKDLAEKGVKFFKHRPAYPPFFRRNIQRLTAKAFNTREFFPVEKRSPFRYFFAEKPDVVCIVQGDSYSFLALPDLIEYCDQAGIPFVVVCQAAINHYRLEDYERTLMREFYQRAYRVALVAEENLKTVERQIAASLPNGIVLQNPVSFTSTASVEWPNDDVANFASVARLEVVNKGQDILFEVLSGPQWRERNWRLNIYGKGPEENYLKKLAKFYGIAEKVNFVGYAENTRKVWEENHLLVMPSRIEGTPLAMIEALLCGRPAVVSDIAGMTEWITEGETGFVAEAPSPVSFGAALERAWRQQDRWKQMGENAHKFSAAKYDPHPGKTLLELLRSAVGK